MKEKIDFDLVPYRYTLCLNNQCPQANTCLRQLAEQSIPETLPSWTYLNPKHLAALNGPCPHYRSSAKVSYAKGLINLLESLPYKQMHLVILGLISHFSRRTYYRIRKGERLLSPDEQQIVLYILHRCGVTDHKDFDAYVEDYEW